MIRLPRTLILTSILLFSVGQVYAGGLLGGFIEDVGRATGIQPIEKTGQELDNLHRDIKNAVPPYKAIEEESSAFVRKRFLDACSATYQTITAFVISRCSNWDGRLDGQDLIRNAVNSLVDAGLFQREEFNGVQIRWCPLSGGHGIAPDRGRIYLDTAAKDDNPDNLAALLAHEMIHIRQYLHMGTDQFKCEYSRKYAECGGCQNGGHPLEREAYEFENQVYKKLNQFGWQLCNKSAAETLWVAYAYKKQNRWIKEGWRVINKGQCSVLLDRIDTEYVSYYAIGSDRVSRGGGIILCVHPKEQFYLVGPEIKWPYNKYERGEDGLDMACTAPYTRYNFRDINTGLFKHLITDIDDKLE